LRHYNDYKNSNIAAKKWLARIVSEYRDKFEAGEVSFILGNVGGETNTLKSLKPISHKLRSPINKQVNINRTFLNETNPNFQRVELKRRILDKAILGLAQAYGPYQFWLGNIAPIANPDATWRAMMVLSALRDKAFIEQAVFLLKSPDSRVRAWSCYYLASVMHVQASDKLLALSNDPSPRVRYHTRKAFIAMQPGSENIFTGNQQFMHGQFPVLVSDDNLGSREKLSAMLMKLGFITYTAAGEKETINLALKNKPQVIVTDNQKITLKGNQKYVDNLSGLNMTWDICRLPELRETLLIMLSADEIEPTFLWQGGDYYLSKLHFGGAYLGNLLNEYMR
jgi:CheY-like chemotaxis protein